MNGCALPVVINSGSGNQGITVSAPIIVYAREMGKSREERPFGCFERKEKYGYLERKKKNGKGAAAAGRIAYRKPALMGLDDFIGDG